MTTDHRRPTRTRRRLATRDPGHRRRPRVDRRSRRAHDRRPRGAAGTASRASPRCSAARRRCSWRPSRTAAEVFRARIVRPARELPRGVLRVATLMRGDLDYSRERVFAGGCFFAATRLTSTRSRRPSPTPCATGCGSGTPTSRASCGTRARRASSRRPRTPSGSRSSCWPHGCGEHAVAARRRRPAVPLAADVIRDRLLASGASPTDLAPLG